MAEPQPPSTHEGADLEDETPALPKSAEDRKAAAAMSSVSARANDDDDDGAQPAKEVDREALGKAMKNLNIDGGGKGVTGAGKKVEDEDEDEEAREKKKKAAAVKVDQADVALLVEELELSKLRATDLLRAHEGDAVKAMESYVTVSA
ncbi:MAG: hypothetical protein M1837_000761 [Sclerophora amabilis]|nr:MAG: hypothetical protein M1837_000761 [Sclerophora amabilis]